MIFTSDQTGRWANWMRAETEYALSKFPESEQRRYFELGVTRGDFSFEMSAVGYFQRAALRSGSLALGDTIALKAVQEVGKSAHNHLACAATAVVVFGADEEYVGAITKCISDWKTLLKEGDISPLALDLSTVPGMSERFASLQARQDEHDSLTFINEIADASLPVHAAFIELASEYGWPQPGVSSSEDVSVWVE